MNIYLQGIKVFTVIGMFSLIFSCKTKGNDSRNSVGSNDISSTKTLSIVKDSVQAMADAIAKNVSHDGPIAWLKYFDNSPGFFMASQGQLSFANYDSANNFIKNLLVKSIIKIELSWSDIRIEPLSLQFASLAATFHEEITNNAGKKIPISGYFTAIAQQTPQGWKLHNAHWSTSKQ